METLADAVANAVKRLYIQSPIQLDDASIRAVNAVNNVLKQGEVLAAIRGPPGTGKTTIYTTTFTDNYDRLGGGRVAAYIAPTNVLVVETFSRQLANVLKFKYGGVITERELVEALSGMRAYGSKIIVANTRSNREIEEVFKSGLVECRKGSPRDCAREVLKALRRVVYEPPTADLKFIFATEWQDIVSRSKLVQIISNIPSRFDIGLFVDEASRSPAYRPFTVIARLLAGYVSDGNLPRSLARLLEKVDIYGLSVIGDDMQAISVDPIYKTKRDLLVLLTVYKTLGCENWSGKQCSMLDKTKRLPRPTHEPISKGFYDDMLDSVVDAERRLASLTSVGSRLRSIGATLSGKKALVLKKVGEALENKSPLVVINTKGFQAGTLVEEQRVAFAALIAAALAAAADAAGDQVLDIAVTAPYSDMVDDARATFYSMIRKFELARIPPNVRVRFATVHSMLGDEADIVITMLGKEWCGSSFDPFGADYLTMYCSEPEAFNVQMSRHRRLLIVLGSIDTLRREMRRERVKDLLGSAKKLARIVSGIGIAAGIMAKVAKTYGTLVSVNR